MKVVNEQHRDENDKEEDIKNKDENVEIEEENVENEDKNVNNDKEESVENEEKDNAKNVSHNDLLERSHSICKECPEALPTKIMLKNHTDRFHEIL